MICLTIAWVVCSGCGRLLSKTPPFYTTGIYAGTRVDVGIISSGGEGLVFLLDLPFSVVADTIMLPKDIYDKQN